MVNGLRGHAAPHAVPVLVIGLAGVVGSVAAFAFQVIAARAVGPPNFGQVAAFLAIITVAATASSALQNAVAVASADPATVADGERHRGPSEATILGLGGGLVVAALTPLLVRALNTTPAMVLLAASAIPLAFWVAQILGVLQGAGRSAAAMWWTTNAMLARVGLVLLVLAIGLGVGGVLAAVLMSIVVAIVGAGLHARRLPRARRAAFTPAGATVLLLTLVSAWLVNSDVIVVRATVAELAAGNFASAAILVKATFLLPAALSMYLLPRFVRTRDNGHLQRLGQWATVGVTAAAAAVVSLVFWLLGDVIARLVFGAAYVDGGDLLLPLSLAYLPWVVAQSVLIRLTAHASRSAVVVLVIGAILQITGFALAAPHIAAVVWVQAVIGTGVLVALLELVRRLDRSTAERSVAT